MKVQTPLIHLSISLLFILAGCSTGSYYTCHHEQEDRNFSYTYPFGTASGRMLTAWKALCRHNHRKAEAVLRDISIDTPSPEVMILLDFNGALRNKEGASEALLAKVIAYQAESQEWILFKGSILSMTKRYEIAWETLQKLDEPIRSKQKVSDLQEWIETEGVSALKEIGWDAFQLEDKQRLRTVLDRFPHEWMDSTAYHSLNTAFQALENPDTFDRKLLSELSESHAEAIESWIGNRNRTLDDRLSEVLNKLSEHPDDERLLRRLYQLKKRWELSNLPSMFTSAIESKALSRAEFGLLIAWQIPEIRLKNQQKLPVVVDLLERKEGPYILPSLSNGLLAFYSQRSHHFEPDRVASAGEILSSILEINRFFNISSCGDTWESLQTCGFIPGSWQPDDPVHGEDAVGVLEGISWKIHGTQ